MTIIFNFDNYKDFINAWIIKQPNCGRGQFRKISIHLRISSVMTSQIFRGDRELNLEQALLLTDFLSLTDLETEYFICLVQKARAGSVNLKKFFEHKRKKLLLESEKLSNHVENQVQLDEKSKYIFYSQWVYSSVRLLTSIEKYKDVASIAKRLDMNVESIQKIVDFLIEHKLCVYDKKGQLQIGPNRTHIGADSPLVQRHHFNWRQKSISHIDKITEEELFYSGPMTLSENTFKSLKLKILDFISQTQPEVVDSPSELLACLNIDLFKV